MVSYEAQPALNIAWIGTQGTLSLPRYLLIVPWSTEPRIYAQLPRILAIEMYYIHHLLKNNYLEWMMKELGKKASTPILNPETGLEIKKRVFIPVLCISGLSEEFKRIFQYKV